MSHQRIDISHQRIKINQQMTTIYIGLGGNIANEYGTPTEHLKNAIKAFQENANFFNVQTSSLYSSKAYGVTDQPDFINAVLKAETNLNPIELLDFCQSLENNAGRVRLRHWGERCLDVDILLYGDEVIHNERLIVPHKELTLRNFVVIPLLELDSDLTVNGQKLKELAVASDWGGLNFYHPVNNYPQYYEQKFLSNVNKNSINELNSDEEKVYYRGLGNYWDWIGTIDYAVQERLEKELPISSEYHQSEWYQNLLKGKKLEHRFHIARQYKQENRNLIEIMLITSLTVEQVNGIIIDKVEK